MTNSQKEERKRVIVDLICAIAWMEQAAASLRDIDDPIYQQHADEMSGAAGIADGWVKEIAKEIKR